MKYITSFLLALCLASVAIAAPENDLFKAVCHRNLAAARQALDAGADVNARAKAGDGKSYPQPLMVACANADLNMVRLLFANGANANVQIFGGENALAYVRSAPPKPERLELLKWLLANTDIDINHLPKSGKSVGKMYGESGALDLLIYLLKQPGYRYGDEFSLPEIRELKQQQERIEHHRKALAKEDKKYAKLLKEKEKHGFEAGIWDEVSRDLGGLTQEHDDLRLDEHRKSRNADHRAAAVKNQRVANLKQAYERDVLKYRKMIEAYNAAHPNAPIKP